MLIQTITNANAYLNGTNSLLGKLAKIELPEIVTKNEDMEALGSFSDIDIPVGIEKLMLKLSWSSFYPDAFADRFNVFETTQMQVRASLQDFGGGGLEGEQPVLAMITGRFSKVMLGAIEARKPITSMDDEMTVHRMELSVGGQEYLAYDRDQNIYRVQGRDMLAGLRQNIGA